MFKLLEIFRKCVIYDFHFNECGIISKNNFQGVKCEKTVFFTLKSFWSFKSKIPHSLKGESYTTHFLKISRSVRKLFSRFLHYNEFNPRIHKFEKISFKVNISVPDNLHGPNDNFYSLK